MNYKGLMVKNLKTMLSILFASLCLYANACTVNDNDQLKAKLFIENALKDTFSRDFTNYNKYFSPQYQQISDGKNLNFIDFIEHVNKVKSLVQNINFKFKSIIVSKNQIVTDHIVTGVKRDGSTIKTEVIAIFTTKSGKIISCNEMSHLILGDDKDKKMASEK